MRKKNGGVNQIKKGSKFFLATSFLFTLKKKIGRFLIDEDAN